MRGRNSNIRDKKPLLITLSITVAVLSLTIGFAAFSTTLTINSRASITPSSDTFRIVFSNTKDSLVAGTVSPASDSTPGIGVAATIDNTNSSTPTIRGLKANFTGVGQKVVYRFYTYNDGEFLAYLTDIILKNASGGTSNKVCTAGTGISEDLLKAACDGITLTVSVDGAEVTSTSTFSGHSLEMDKTHDVVVTIEYTSGPVDGDFSVSFGDIEVKYSTVDGVGTQGGTPTETPDDTNEPQLLISLVEDTLYIDYSKLGVTGGMHELQGYGIPMLYLNGEEYPYGNDYFNGNTANLNKILGEGTHTVYATIFIYGTEQTIKSNTIVYTYDGVYTTES